MSILSLAAAVIMLLFSAFFSCAESSLMSLSRSKIRRMENGSFGERVAYRLLQAPQKLLGSVLLGNMFVNTCLAACSAGIITSLSQCLPHSELAGAILNVVIATPLLMICGDLAPKTLAINRAEKYSALTAPPLYYISLLISPILWLLKWITAPLLRLCGSQDTGWAMLTYDEIKATLSGGESSGAMSRDEHRLMERLIKFGSLTARDIMIPREEVIGVDDSLPLRTAYLLAIRSRRRFLPVYHQTPDNCWGVITISDYAEWRDSARINAPVSEFKTVGNDGDSMLTPIYPIGSVGTDARLDSLLLQMRYSTTKMAVVMDADRRMLGLLTYGSIMRSIIGSDSVKNDGGRGNV